MTQDDPQLTADQLKRFTRNGSGIRAWQVRSMAQELVQRREWDAPPPAFIFSAAEQKVIEGIRAMQAEQRDAA